MQRAPGSILALIVLCSCATREPVTPAGSSLPSNPLAPPPLALPSEQPINRGAGRGDYLFVTIRLEDGEALPFVLDTGSGATIFDKVFAPQLGKNHGSVTLSRFGVRTKSFIFDRPKFYLGGAQLQFTGQYVATYDFSRESAHAGRTIMGLIGMDCLSHYVLQLDFDAGKMRFLDRASLDTSKLGVPYFLVPYRGRPVLSGGCLMGGDGEDALIDTGTKVDGGLNTELFEDEARRGSINVSTNTPLAGEPKFAAITRCDWNGGVYTNLIVANIKGENLIGLRFLARHLVTLDFPDGRLYLKQTRSGPLAGAH